MVTTLLGHVLMEFQIWDFFLNAILICDVFIHLNRNLTEAEIDTHLVAIAERD